MFPLPPPPTEPVICIHETLGRGPEWLCGDYVEARPVTVGLFIRWWTVFSSFFLIHYFFNFLHKWDWIKTSTTPHPVDMAFLIQNPRSRVCFHPPKACCGRPNFAASTRPTCPRWRPPQRRARWGPPCGRSTPPLSSCQLRSAEMTSCYSSSSADRRPPEVGRRGEKKRAK